MKKTSKAIGLILVMFLMILIPTNVMAEEPWEKYKNSTILETLSGLDFSEFTIALFNADIGTMSEENKKEFRILLDKWFNNSLCESDEGKLYKSSLEAKRDMLSNYAPTPNPTSPTIEAPKPSGGKNYLFASEGVDFDWKTAVNIRLFNTTDIASVAPQAEMYVKIDMSEIDDIDKYLTGIDMIVSNNLWKNDSIYRPIYDMTQTRLDELSVRINLTTEQRNKINSLKEKTEDAKQDNIGNSEMDDPLAVPTPTPRTPVTGNKVRNEVAIYQPDEKTSPDEIIDEGSSFIQAGKDNQGAITVDGEKLQQGSNMLYNIAFAVGIVVAVGIGSYLGIKFMMGGAEEKASIKETLIPYFVGVIIMFSSFTIWKLVLVLLQSIDNI